MIDTAVIFASTFLTVFALGFQSLNVNQGQYFWAAVTSVAISSGHIWLYKLLPDAGLLQALGYYLGGISGITASMWTHRRTIGRRARK